MTDVSQRAVLSRQGIRDSLAPVSDRMPRIVTVTLVSLLIPVYFAPGGLLLSPARIVLLVLVPMLMTRLLRGVYGPITAIDWLVFVNLALSVLSIFVNNPEQAVTFAGSNAMMILGGYLVGRTMIRSPAQFQGLSRLLAVLVLCSLPFAIYETITGHMIIGEMIDRIPGVYSNKYVNYTRRLGLARVQFVFAHPIHYGLFCSTALSLCYIGLASTLSTVTRILFTALILLAVFLSVSSGPFLSAMTQISLILWMIVMARIKQKWKLLGGILLVLYVIAEVFSNRPAIYVLVSMLAFDPFTANARRILLDYGLAQIGRAPLLGIGYHSFPMPAFMTGSVDNQWLLIAIAFGVPALAALWGSILLIFYRMTRNTKGGALYDMQRLAWCITMISLILTMATVAIWGEMLTIFYFFVGCGAWMANPVQPWITAPDTAYADPAAASGLSGTRYSRFAVQQRRQ